MSTDETANTPTDGGFIAFSNDNPSSNWRKTPFKSSHNNSPHQNRHDQFSPFHGSPQGFSSPIYHQRNFNANRRQSGNSYGDRFRGNQSHNRGNNWKNRSDNRRPNNNRSFNKNESVDISEYFHPSMIQDPWRHLLPKPFETNTLNDKNCEEIGVETKEEDEPGGDSSSPST
ncbi:hypothetical protein HA402_004844 [Bradysia odoriphaga]|nr:hypothetical protein HA402_004844 [Bradysia odoriphaga]